LYYAKSVDPDILKPKAFGDSDSVSDGIGQLTPRYTVRMQPGCEVGPKRHAVFLCVLPPTVTQSHVLASFFAGLEQSYGFGINNFY
jgi:hypothetical protein